MTHSFAPTVKKPKIVFNPHPVIDNFQISGIDGNVLLVISDLHCRVVFTKNIVCDESISLQTIPRGIYVAKLITANGIEHRKLEKK
jgi:hypothetical protein